MRHDGSHRSRNRAVAWTVRRTCAACALAGLGVFFHVRAAADASTRLAQFDPRLLRIPVDVGQYAQARAVPPGTYRIDLYVNTQWKGRTDVRFAQTNGARVALPCFDLKLLDELGFDEQHLTAQARETLADGAWCAPMAELFASASATYRHDLLRLDVTASQSVLRRAARGFVDPALWDAGVPAAALQYHYNGWRRSVNDRHHTSHTLNIHARANAGDWRMHYSAAVSRSSGSSMQYRSNLFTVERGFAAWQNRIILGQTVTEGRVFDPLSITGLRLESDERMRPDSQRGFAPVVRGIAQSTARVRIRQLGALVYETTVPPGPFVIDDLYPTGTSGDLLVTVTEADGAEHSFTVAYAGMVELVRPGVTDYTLALGRSRDARLRDKPGLAQATVRHGFNNTLTGYGGLMGSEGYVAAAAGVGLNLPIGAVVTDLTLTRTRNPLGGSYRGFSLRAAWSKRLPVVETHVDLAAYRYSSADYFEPAEAFALRDGIARDPRQQRRNRLVVSLHQSLPRNLGVVSASASSQDYWQRGGRDTQYQIGYSVGLAQLMVSLSASRMRNVLLDRWDNQVMLTLSMPLGDAGQPLHLNTQWLRSGENHFAQVGVVGAFGRDRQFNANVYGTRDAVRNQPAQVGGGAVLRWTAPGATLGATASRIGTSRQIGLSASGGVVAFQDGVVFGNALGDTVAVVQARDAAGAQVVNRIGVRLDGNGHAIVPHLRTYRQNEIRLDPTGLPADVTLSSTSQRVAPTAGAMVLLRYRTQRSYAVLIDGKRADGKPLPFAATVFDAEDREVGHVGQAGQALVRVNQTAGVLSVRWGEGAHQRCVLTYAVDAALKAGERFRRTDAVCR